MNGEMKGEEEEEKRDEINEQEQKEDDIEQPTTADSSKSKSKNTASAKRYILFVGNLHYRTKKEELLKLFNEQAIMSIRMPTDKKCVCFPLHRTLHLLACQLTSLSPLCLILYMYISMYIELINLKDLHSLNSRIIRLYWLVCIHMLHHPSSRSTHHLSLSALSLYIYICM